MVEAGLIRKWKLRTWNRMKRDSDQEPVAFTNPPAAEPLTLDTLQTAFLGGYSTLRGTLSMRVNSLSEVTSKKCNRACLLEMGVDLNTTTNSACS